MTDIPPGEHRFELKPGDMVLVSGTVSRIYKNAEDPPYLASIDLGNGEFAWVPLSAIRRDPADPSLNVGRH